MTLTATEKWVLDQVREYENQPRFDKWANSSPLMIVISKPIHIHGSVWDAIRRLVETEQICYDGEKLIRYRAV